MRFPPLAILLLIAVTLTLAPANWAQQKPLTQDQVQGLVRSGLGDETGAKAIEQRGIDFAPGEDFLQSLKAAGASEVFLKALRAAKQPEPVSAKKPLNQVQVFALLAGGVPSHRVTMLVQERGIDFEPTDDYLQEVRLAGGEDELISALRGAKVTKPERADPALQVRQEEVRQHVARGSQFMRDKRHGDAEAEYRTAVRLDPRNADLHFSLGVALAGEGDWDGVIREEREALRLNPNNGLAHSWLGIAFEGKGDLDGAIVEYRENVRLNPKDGGAHVNLGFALKFKGDLDGMVAECREALRLNPSDGFAHCCLGDALAGKGDVDGVIAEEREAIRLNPNISLAHQDLGGALASKGDFDGAIAEEREALRVDPNNDRAHVGLGVALGKRGDLDGAIAEERDAVRLNPNDGLSHFCLGVMLERKGDYPSALKEYRAAYELDPKDSSYRENYERLLQEVNQ